MQAIVTQRGNDDEVRAIWDMTTAPAASLMRLKDYGIAVGAPADLVCSTRPIPSRRCAPWRRCWPPSSAAGGP